MDPVVILGPHKSGTSLLRSLLDGHPRLAVLAREPHFFERSGTEVRYPLRPSSPQMTTHIQFGARVADALDVEAHDENLYSDSPGWRGYDSRIFGRLWSEREPTTAGVERYVTYLRCLWEAAGNAPIRQDQRPVDKSTEYVEFGSLLRFWLSDVRILHVLRDPYATLVAIRRYHYQLGGATRWLLSAAEAIAQSFRSASDRRELRGFHVLRYEDLVVEPESTMRGVAEALGVGFDPLMLTPTCEGRPWTGNSGDGIRVPVIRREPSEAWLRELTDTDVAVVNAAVSRHDIERWGYPHRKSGLLQLRRLPGERLRTWLANRAVSSPLGKRLR